MLKKIIATLFTKGFVALINLVILLVSSRQLGGDVRGQVSLLILNIAIIQAINEIYTGYALVYFIPRFSLKKIYSNGFILSIVCTILSGAFFYSISSYFYDKPWAQEIRNQLIHIIILSFVIILHSFHGVILLAKEKIRLYNFLNFFQPALLLIALLINVFILNNYTVMSYIISLYVSFLTSFIISTTGIYAVFKETTEHNALYNGTAIFKNGFYNQLANLSHMLSNRYNFYLIASNAMVGVYSTSTTLIESVLIISSSAATIILTHIANNKDEANQVRITFLLSKICFVLSLMAIIVLLVIPSEFFTFLLGKDYTLTKPIMLALAPGILFISFSTLISHYFSGLGKQRIIAIANFSGLFTTISTSYYLVNHYQVFGACYSTCLSYFVASMVLVIMFMKENKLSFSSLFKMKNDLAFFKTMK